MAKQQEAADGVRSAQAIPTLQGRQEECSANFKYLAGEFAKIRLKA